MSKKFKRISTFKDNIRELTVIYRRTALKTYKIISSKSAAEFIRPYFEEFMDDHEQFWVLFLNNSNNIASFQCMSKGSVAGTVVPIKLILRNSLVHNISATILVHNHPSGTLRPSKADIEISKKLREASELFNIKVLDSIIITREGYYSLADNADF